MTTTLRSTGFGLTVAACVLWAATAAAQTPPASSSTPPPVSADTTRPATTTFFGDTGLWFVPTAEVLPDGKWSVSGYRRGTNYIQGFSNIGDFAGTFGFGIKDRAEVFGSFLVDTRIDRDLRPIFINDSTVGGIIDRYPGVTKGWTGNSLGDLYLGVKVNLLSEWRQNQAALAVRGMVKAPTGDKDNGVSTGKPDVAFDVIVSKDAQKKVDVSAYAGYEARGSTDGITGPGGALRWGAGAAFPSHSPLRGVFEVNGFKPSSDVATLSGASFVGFDGSRPPITSATENLTRATFALTWQNRKGFFLGGGVSWNVPMKDRSGFNTDEDAIGDFVDWQIRIGYHPGVRVYVPPPPPEPTPVPTPPPAPTHNLSVRAQCDPCTVEVGRTSTLTAVPQSSISCVVTYRWTAPTGTFANPTARQTVWTAPNQEGSVPATITVTCPSDGRTATDTVTIQVVRPVPVVELNFEDVYFDFDRSTLRPEALRLLDDAVTKLQANPGRNIVIEGHTCSIGTAEYNLALGERRAASVRNYLTSRGVPAARLETRSYGEESPKFDNSREETRRLNRRAALVVKVQ